MHKGYDETTMNRIKNNSESDIDDDKSDTEDTTDFKFIGTVESTTNDFYKTSVLAHFT